MKIEDGSPEQMIADVLTHIFRQTGRNITNVSAKWIDMNDVDSKFNDLRVYSVVVESGSSTDWVKDRLGGVA